MSLRDDLIRVNDALSSALNGVNESLVEPVDTIVKLPRAVAETADKRFSDGEQLGYEAGFEAGKAAGGGYDDGFKDGQLALLEDSKYMRGAASGELVSLKDVSPVEHTVGVEVFSKNLANLSNPRHSTFSQVVEQTENTITIEATATGRKWLGVYYALSEDLVGKTLTISGAWQATNANVQNAIRVQWVGENNSVIGGMLGYINASGQTRTFSVAEKPADATYLGLILYAVADSTTAVAGDTVTFSNVQLEVGTTATPYTPYIEDTSDVKVQVLGKNWYNSSFAIGGLAGANGNEYQNEERARSGYIEVKENEFYIFSCEGYVVTNKHAYDKDKKWIAPMGNGVAGKPQTLKTPEGTCFVRIVVKKADETSFTSEDIEALNGSNAQLELGTNGTDYEPYRGAEYEQGEPIASISPNMTVTTDTDGATVSVEYLRDIDAYIDNLTGASAVMTLEEPMEEE